MIDHGVRLNDFGIVKRANRYFYNHDSRTPIVDHSKEKVESEKTTTKKIETEYAVKPSINLDLWVGLCSTVGFLSYGIFDQMVVFAFCQRVLEKYILKTATDA
jgi:hypothetical protein